MKVLMVSSLWPPNVLGGAERYAHDLASRLEEEGHEVAAVTMGAPGRAVLEEVRPWPYRLEQYAREPRGRRSVFHLRDLYNVDTGRVLTRAITDFAPDVVHSHSVQGMSVLALTRPSEMGVAHVHTIHDYWLLCQRASMVRSDGTACEGLCTACAAVSRWRRHLMRRHRPDVFIAVSDAVAREHARLPALRDRIRVVLNPFDDREVPERRPHDGPPVFGFLGQLVESKGVLTLLRAVEHPEMAGVRLLIAGDGPLRAEVEARVSPRIEYWGWVDDARRDELLASIDCLVVPSEWKEPGSLVITEARAAKVPVIGTRVGGTPEMLPTGSVPLMFEAGDVGGLRARMAAFAADPARYRTFEGGGPGWGEHLAAVLRAYDDARSAALSYRKPAG